MTKYIRHQSLLVLAVVLLALFLAFVLIQTRREVQKVLQENKPILVKVINAQKSDQPVIVTAYGTVQGNRELDLKPEVSGRVIDQSENLVIGGLLKKNELILMIDPRDYRIIVEQEKAAVEKAEAELRIEQGRQIVAKREWELLDPSVQDKELSSELALRKPQLRQKKADLTAVKSRLRKAQLDLTRTILKAPFNAVVVDEAVEPDDLLTPQTEIAKLVATDEFRVRVSVPINQLRWVEIPGAKATVVHELGSGRVFKREGEVIRLLGDVDPSGRMARVLVVIYDPLGLENPQYREHPLLLGTYVRVNLQGSTLHNVFVVPREAIRQKDNVWIKTADSELEIRKVNIVYRGKETVIVDQSLKEGEEIVVSSIPVAIPGMQLRTVSQ